MNEKGYSRVDRVGAAIVKILASSVSDMARDSGAGMATVSKVLVSPDLRRATITISLYASEDKKLAFIKHLGSQGYLLQKELAAHLKSKRTPVLDFKLDEEIEVLHRIGRLLSNEPTTN